MLVVDITKVANRKVDVEKITAAARNLAGTGATVRVRVYDTLRGSKDINALGEKTIRECGWTLGDGRRQSNLLFIPFAVEQGDIAVLTGSAINARLSESVATKAITTHMVPRWQSYKQDQSALTNGLVAMLNSFRVELARPLVNETRSGGTTTIVNHAPSDYSGLGKALILIVVTAGIALGFVLWKRSSEDKGEAAEAQAQASRARGNCIDRLLHLSDENEKVVRQAKVDGARSAISAEDARTLDSALREINALGSRGLAAFSRFDSPQGEDPNRSGLSVGAYHSNHGRYEEIIAQFIEPAERLIAQIDQTVEKASKPAAA